MLAGAGRKSSLPAAETEQQGGREGWFLSRKQAELLVEREHPLRDGNAAKGTVGSIGVEKRSGQALRPLGWPRLGGGGVENAFSKLLWWRRSLGEAQCPCPWQGVLELGGL